MRILLADQHYPSSSTLRKQRMEWWEKGIAHHEDTTHLLSKDPGGFFDVSISWGPRMGPQLKQRSFHHLVMECGFLGQRLQNLSLFLSDLNGRGRPAVPTIRGRGEPWLAELKPWRIRDHKRVVIFCQVPRDASLLPLSPDFDALEKNYLRWLNGVVQLCQSKGMEVGVRKHPSVSPRWWELNTPAGVLDLTYEEWPKERIWEWADVATAFSSNALVEACMAGVDVVPAHPTSLVWDLRCYFGESRLLTYQKKMDWLDFVATSQWSIEEIESGTVWGYVRANL